MKNTAPEQKRIMRFLPLVFGIVLIRFPAGLFVYWVTSNVISIVQNLLIYRNVPKQDVKGTEEPDVPDTSDPTDDGHPEKPVGDAATPDRTTPNGAGQGTAEKKGKVKKRR